MIFSDTVYMLLIYSSVVKMSPLPQLLAFPARFGAQSVQCWAVLVSIIKNNILFAFFFLICHLITDCQY